MPHSLLGSIPRVSFTPYASHPKPLAGPVLYDPVYTDDQVSLKVCLRDLLKTNRLSKMPIGFPFHSVPNGHGGSYLSHESYEFQESFCFSDYGSRHHYATFSYTAPRSGRHSREPQRMTWRICIPARVSSVGRNTASTISIAHVEVDPLVMETGYGITVMTNPRVMLEALALSVELGILVTIHVADPRTPYKYPARRGIYYCPGDIVFIATDNHLRSEVVFVFPRV